MNGDISHIKQLPAIANSNPYQTNQVNLPLTQTMSDFGLKKRSQTHDRSKYNLKSADTTMYGSVGGNIGNFGDQQAMNPADYISEDFLQVLEEHRKICEKEGKFQEAQQAKKRLKELRKLEDFRKREVLVTRHKAEMKALENAHKAELKELINKWQNIIMPNFENEAALLEIELKKRHQNELESFKEQIEKDQHMSAQGTGSTKVHYSSEILNLKKKSDLLGQQGFYNEAKKVKRKIKELKQIEKEKHEITSKGKFLNKSQLLVVKHQKELQSLKKKHSSQRESLVLQQQKEFDIIEKRFVNVWNDMEAKFRKEIKKLDAASPMKKMRIREQVLSSQRGRTFL